MVQRTLASQNMSRLGFSKVCLLKNEQILSRKERNKLQKCSHAYDLHMLSSKNPLSYPCLSKVGCNVSTCFPNSNQPKIIRQHWLEWGIYSKHKTFRKRFLGSVVCVPRPAVHEGQFEALLASLLAFCTTSGGCRLLLLQHRRKPPVRLDSALQSITVKINVDSMTDFEIEIWFPELIVHSYPAWTSMDWAGFHPVICSNGSSTGWDIFLFSLYSVDSWCTSLFGCKNSSHASISCFKSCAALGFLLASHIHALLLTLACLSIIYKEKNRTWILDWVSMLCFLWLIISSNILKHTISWKSGSKFPIISSTTNAGSGGTALSICSWTDGLQTLSRLRDDSIIFKKQTKTKLWVMVGDFWV